MDTRDHICGSGSYTGMLKEDTKLEANINNSHVQR